MLSEEESAIKKLNEILKKWQKIVNIEDKTEREIEMSLYMEDMPFEEIKTVLNLMTKLQKEIDCQKEKRENQKVELAILNEKQKEMNKLKNTVSSYHGMFKKQEKQIKELQKENEEKDKQIESKDRLITIAGIELDDREKQIDLMAKSLRYDEDLKYEVCKNCEPLKEELCGEPRKTQFGPTELKCVKQYFKKLAKEKGEK